MDNVWLVGVGTGLIVSFVSKIGAQLFEFYLSKKSKKDYDKAKDLVIKKLEPLSKTLVIPQDQIIQAIINSVARSSKIDSTDLYTTQEVKEDLLTEIVSSSFLTEEGRSGFIEHFIQSENESIASISTSVAENLDRNYDKKIIISERNRSERLFFNKYFFAGTIFATVAFILFIRALFFLNPQISTEINLVLAPLEEKYLSVFSITLSVVILIQVLQELLDKPTSYKSKTNKENDSFWPSRHCFQCYYGSVSVVTNSLTHSMTFLFESPPLMTLLVSLVEFFVIIELLKSGRVKNAYHEKNNGKNIS